MAIILVLCKKEVETRNKITHERIEEKKRKTKKERTTEWEVVTEDKQIIEEDKDWWRLEGVGP